VAIGNHLLNGSVVIVNAIIVQSVLEECRTVAGSLKFGEDIGCRVTWTIVEGQSDDSWDSALGNDLAVRLSPLSMYM